MANPSTLTEKALWETLGATRSDLWGALVSFAPASQTNPVVRQIQQNEVDLPTQVVAPVTTQLLSKGIMPISDPIVGVTPPVVTPQSVAVVTGVLNGVAASWQAYGQGVPTPL